MKIVIGSRLCPPVYAGIREVLAISLYKWAATKA